MVEQAGNTIAYTADYFYTVSLFMGAVVNWLLAGLLLFDHNNHLYHETPRYLRARRLTALSLVVFGIGFFVHWLLLPRYTSPVAASALSIAYFHAAGTFFSISHTSLIDRHYLSRTTVIRDSVILSLSLFVYCFSVITGNSLVLHIGFILFFGHIGYLTWNFYLSFQRIYVQLGNYANEYSNDCDREIRWLFFSCHLIIFFGIAGMVVTAIFPNDTTPFTILMFIGIIVFGYIYKALDNYGAVVREVEQMLIDSEQFLKTEYGRREMRHFMRQRAKHDILSVFPFLSGFLRQW